MQLATTTQFHDHVTKYIRSKEPVVITRKRGEKLAGVFYPYGSKDLPIETWKTVFKALTKQVAEDFKKKGIMAESFLEDFEESYHRTKSSSR